MEKSATGGGRISAILQVVGPRIALGPSRATDAVAGREAVGSISRAPRNRSIEIGVVASMTERLPSRYARKASMARVAKRRGGGLPLGRRQGRQTAACEQHEYRDR